MREQPTLYTERLVLRPFRLSDAPAVQRLAGAQAIANNTLTIPYPYHNGLAEAWIRSHKPEFEARRLANFAITLLENGVLIGTIGLSIHAEYHRAELGYWIGRPYWGQGYCTEAGHTMLEYAFRTLELNRVHASHFSWNPSSGRVMQKLGLLREGCAREHVTKGSGFVDLELYGILRREWEARQGGTADG